MTIEELLEKTILGKTVEVEEFHNTEFEVIEPATPIDLEDDPALD